MARKRSKKNKLLSFFMKSNIDITYFYSPSMNGGDVWYYMVLEDVIRFRFQIKKESFIIIDEITPLTISIVKKTCNSMLDYLFNQTEYAVFISLIGNTEMAHSFCNEIASPIVDSSEFSTFPIKMYDDMKRLYGSDKIRYGFYIVALPEMDNMEDYSDQSESIEDEDDGSVDPIDSSETIKFYESNYNPIVDTVDFAEAFCKVVTPSDRKSIERHASCTRIRYSGISFDVIKIGNNNDKKPSFTIDNICGLGTTDLTVLIDIVKALSAVFMDAMDHKHPYNLSINTHDQLFGTILSTRGFVKGRVSTINEIVEYIEIG